jgi:hypothetical protein
LTFRSKYEHYLDIKKKPNTTSLSLANADVVLSWVGAKQESSLV